MNGFKYLVVDGLVKSGKTRLTKILAEHFNARLILDNKENPFIQDFFQDIVQGESTYGLKTQLIYLLNRYAQQLEIRQKGLFQKITASNYLFFRDGIYAHIALNDEELEIYKKIFKIFSENIVNADLAIYLQTSFAEMMRRINEYGTEEEKSAPNEYWREVFEAYNYYFFNYKNSPLLVVNMEKIDLDNPTDIQNLIKEINNHEKGTRYYAPA